MVLTNSTGKGGQQQLSFNPALCHTPSWQRHQAATSCALSPITQVKEGKKSKFRLAVADPKLGSAIQEATSIPCVCNDAMAEMTRGVRMHFTRFIGELKDQDLTKAQLGLAHSYSRSKVLSCCPHMSPRFHSMHFTCFIAEL